MLDGTLSVVGAIGKSSMPIYLGGNPQSSGVLGNPANVIFSDVLVFDRALSADEIAANYSGEILESGVDKIDLLLYYNFKD